MHSTLTSAREGQFLTRDLVEQALPAPPSFPWPSSCPSVHERLGSSSIQNSENNLLVRRMDHTYGFKVDSVIEQYKN